MVGLVGTIGAGKSAAAAALARRGGAVIDADRLGHAVLDQTAVREVLVQRWGPKVQKADGGIDRRAVAGIVFADPAERLALERVVFPPITALARDQIAAARADPAVRFVVLDAPTLLEAGWDGLADRLVYVDAPPAERLRRVAARGWTAADLRAREAAQWPADRKRVMCHAELMNDGSTDELQSRVDRLLSTWGLGGPEDEG